MKKDEFYSHVKCNAHESLNLNEEKISKILEGIETAPLEDCLNILSNNHIHKKVKKPVQEFILRKYNN